MNEYKMLWDEVFADPADFSDYYHRNKCTKNKIIDYRKNGELIGMLHLNPYTVYANSEVVDSYYIVGVAVKKEYRERGIMRDMMYRAIKLMRDEGCPFTFLMPEKDIYYKGFGFERIYETELITINDCDLGIQVKNCMEHIYDLSCCDEKELDRLALYINDCMKKHYNYFSVRTKEYLLDMLDEHICQCGGVNCAEYKDSFIIFSYDIYEACMYVERLEVLNEVSSTDAYELVKNIAKYALKKGCKKCKLTVPKCFAENVRKNNDCDFMSFEAAHGIMALSLDEGSMNVENMKNASFFDEIV